MRICFATDFHGRESHYAELFELLRAERPDLLLLGGDMFPDGAEPDPPSSQAEHVRTRFTTRVRQWCASVPGMSVAGVCGNHDWVTTVDAIRAAEPFALLDPHSTRRFGGFDLIGFGCSPPTPFWLKDFERLDTSDDAIPDGNCRVWNAETRAIRYISAAEHFRSRPTLEAELGHAIEPTSPWIFVCHAPPFDSKLDRLPHVAHPVGSKAVRAFIESRRPVISFHGHIHESPEVSGGFFERIGETLCINPGQSSKRLYAVTLDADRPRDTLRHTVFS